MGEWALRGPCRPRALRVLQPLPALPRGILIGLANKYYDLARQGDAMAADHYGHLERHASDCVQCGHCDARCPFGVPQSSRMQEIAAYFRK